MLHNFSHLLLTFVCFIAPIVILLKVGRLRTFLSNKIIFSIVLLALSSGTVQAVRSLDLQNEGTNIASLLRIFISIITVYLVLNSSKFFEAFINSPQKINDLKNAYDLEVQKRAKLESKLSSLHRSFDAGEHLLKNDIDSDAAISRSLIDGVRDFAIYMLSPEGNILSWNSGASIATGYTTDDIIGSHFSFLGTFEDLAQKKYESILSDCATRGRCEFKCWKLRKDGKTFWSSEVITSIHDAQNVLLGFSVVARDLTEQHQSEIELSRHQMQLKLLAVKQEEIREEERTRIARELHDVLGQALTVFKLGLNSAAGTLARKSEDSSLFSLNLQMQQMSSNVDYMIKCVRKIASELRPPILDSLGLVAALEWQIGEFSKATAVHCDFICNARQLSSDNSQTTALFRCTQELLTNVARHAEASNVKVSLNRQDDCMLLEVVDDGRGISETAAREKKTLGLMGIQERVNLAGGTFSIAANENIGTKAILRIPIRANSNNTA